MQAYSTIIYSLMGIIVFALSIYLGIVLNQLRLQKKQQDLVIEQLKEKEEKRLVYINESLRVISLAVTQDQCEISEGCIRIKNLLDELEDFRQLDQLSYFHTAYEDFKQFPFLDDRKALTKQERFKQDNKRFLFEEQHMQGIKQACAELLKLLAKK